MNQAIVVVIITMIVVIFIGVGGFLVYSNMKPKITEPDKLNVGDSVRCIDDDNDDIVYRSVDETTIRLYPNPVIASSWNENWDTNIQTVDCTELTKGNPMGYKLTRGDSIQCSGDDPSENKIYRAMHEYTIRPYPNREVALTWNEDWDKDTMLLDCTNFNIGPPLEEKST